MHSLALIAIFVLLAQGIWTWMRHNETRHVRAFGVLTILLAGLGFLGYYQFVNGSLVLSREFGFVLAHGERARFWLAVFLLGCALISGLAWRIARLEAGKPVGFPRYIVTGIVIGLWSAWLIKKVDSGQNSGLALYSYDIWWPPLAIWVTLCLVASMMRALRLTSDFAWRKRHVDLALISGVTTAVSILAFFAIYQRSAIFNDSVWLWRITVLIVVPLSLLSTVYIAAQKHLEGSMRTVWLLIISLTAGLVLAWQAIGHPQDVLVYLSLWAAPLAIALALLAWNAFQARVAHQNAHRREPCRFQVASADWTVQYGDTRINVQPGTAVDLPPGSYGSDASLDFPKKGGRYRFRVTPVDKKNVPPRSIRLCVSPAAPGDTAIESTARPGDAFGADLYLRSSADDWCDPPSNVTKLVHIGRDRYETVFDVPAEADGTGPLHVAALIAVIAFSLAALFLGLGQLATAVAIAIFFASWTVLSDLLWHNGLIAKTFHYLKNPEKLRAGAAASVKALGEVLAGIGGGIAGIFEGDKLWQGVLKVLFAIALVIALAEIPNANKTIIMPFHVNSYSAPAISQLWEKDANAEALGQLVTDLVVQELRSISSELSREAILNVSNEPNRAPQDSLDVYYYDSGAAEQALAESGSIDLPGGIKLPAQLLLWPIQKPMRYVLDTNVVSGTVIRLESGFALIASSSRGKTWRVDSTPLGVAVADESSSGTPDTGTAVDDAGEGSQESVALCGGEQLDRTSSAAAPTSGLLPALARQLAFKIVVDNLGSRLHGMTTDWIAYSAYKEGIDKLQSFQLCRRGDITFNSTNLPLLEQAIADLELATEKDGAFGWAYYYLGLAYQEYGQNLKAQDAFEQSLSVSPDLAAARIALAYHIAWTKTSGMSGPPGALGDENASDGTRGDPWALWLSVVDNTQYSWQDQASAFSGLAELEYRALAQKISASGYYADDRIAKAMTLSAYYLARRAVRLSDRYRRDSVGASDLRRAHANALNLVGVILDTVARKTGPVIPLDWTCLYGRKPKETQTVAVGSYTAKALEYYRRAAEIQPTDATIQCNAAVAALALGDIEPMERIRNIAGVRRYTGDRIPTPDKPYPDNVEDLFRKLFEYQAAIERDNIDLRSRNSAAYTYYVYRRDHPKVETNAEWLLNTGLWAEEVIREGIRLAEVLGRSDADIYRSTLAEVLLALQRPAEAFKVLEKLNETLPAHHELLEVRWDLAQAYLCLAARNTGSLDQHLKAQSVLSKLREQDLAWDLPKYRIASHTFDAREAKQMCRTDGEYNLFDSDAIAVTYRMVQSHTSDVICAKNVAQITVPKIGRFYVKIWGRNGMRGNLELDDGATEYLTLSWEQRPAENEFFTRLYEWQTSNAKGSNVQGKYVPVTSVERILTHTDCARNRTEIRFESLAAD